MSFRSISATKRNASIKSELYWQEHNSVIESLKGPQMTLHWDVNLDKEQSITLDHPIGQVLNFNKLFLYQGF